MEKQIKEFLSLISTGDMYIPFETKTETNDDYEIIEERTTRLHNDTIEISYSYVSGIDIDKIDKDISALYRRYPELCVRQVFNCQRDTKRFAKYCDGLNARNKLEDLKINSQSQQYPYGFIGTLASNDLALVYRDKTLTGGIYLPDGKTAFISAKIDNYGNIGMLDINVFEDISYMVVIADYDGKGALISYNNVDEQIEFLTGKGINPDLSMQIDFNQILIENHHSDFKNYMVLIHTFKDTIIGKIQEAMQSEKVKTK